MPGSVKRGHFAYVLLEAGLGEKKIVIPDIHMNGEEFRDILFEEFSS